MIPLFKIHHPKGIGRKIEKIFQKGSITEGEISDQFEKSFADYIGNPNCTLTNSCTSALTLAFRLAGVENGDEVISSPMTCMATNEPISSFGANIVWADVNPSTGNIDPNDVERKITKKTNINTKPSTLRTMKKNMFIHIRSRFYTYFVYILEIF